VRRDCACVGFAVFERLRRKREGVFLYAFDLKPEGLYAAPCRLIGQQGRIASRRNAEAPNQDIGIGFIPPPTEDRRLLPKAKATCQSA
jgi:hypothetical protein